MYMQLWINTVFKEQTHESFFSFLVANNYISFMKKLRIYIQNQLSLNEYSYM